MADDVKKEEKKEEVVEKQPEVKAETEKAPEPKTEAPKEVPAPEKSEEPTAEEKPEKKEEAKDEKVEKAEDTKKEPAKKEEGEEQTVRLADVEQAGQDKGALRKVVGAVMTLAGLQSSVHRLTIDESTLNHHLRPLQGEFIHPRYVKQCPLSDNTIGTVSG